MVTTKIFFAFISTIALLTHDILAETNHGLCSDYSVQDDVKVTIDQIYERKCIGPVSGVIHTSIYSFSFESWVRGAGATSRHAFGHCFQNLSQNTVWLSNPKFDGYMLPDKSAGVLEFETTDSCSQTKAEFKYGARPHKHPFTLITSRIWSAEEARAQANGGDRSLAATDVDHKEERTEAVIRAAMPVKNRDGEIEFIDTYYYFVSSVERGDQDASTYSYSIAMFAPTKADSDRATKAGLTLHIDNDFVMDALASKRWKGEEPLVAGVGKSVIAAGRLSLNAQQTLKSPATKQNIELSILQRGGDLVGKFVIIAFAPDF